MGHIGFWPVLTYANDINMVGENVGTVKKNTEALLVDIK
jgi:hypothetical protein